MTLYLNDPDGHCVCGVSAEVCTNHPFGTDCCGDCRHTFWVPVKTTRVYRMVATKVDGRLKRWPFAKEKAARKHLADLEKDIEERPLCGYTDPFLESREVTEWEPMEGEDDAADVG